MTSIIGAEGESSILAAFSYKRSISQTLINSIVFQSARMSSPKGDVSKFLAITIVIQLREWKTVPSPVDIVLASTKYTSY